MTEQDPTFRPVVPERQVAVFLSGLNAETIDQGPEAEIDQGDSADEEGHIVSGAVLRRRTTDRSMVPVRVRIAHGVGAQTASSMLRKMADLIDAEPDFLSSSAGTAVRRLPDGSTRRKQLTANGVLEAAHRLGEEDRAKVLGMIDEIRMELTDGFDESESS